ncbi:MAG: hypothetical protein ACJ0NC_01305 [Candidatus Marivariicella sp.]|tara:strand:- start:13897 stop:14166 length:270 start_codon:yes stop_codon:yes gene_type:complete
MASIKKLKKDINNSIGSFIEDVYLWELNNPKSDIKKSEALIDESINLFDRLISKVKISDKKNPKFHYKNLKEKLNLELNKIILKLNKLK